MAAPKALRFSPDKERDKYPNSAATISVSHIVSNSNAATPSLPLTADSGESTSDSDWFEDIYAKRISLDEFLPLALNARGGTHNCLLGERKVGGFNVAITLNFDDGVEWIVKAPKDVNKETMSRLDSEVATLKFLKKEVGTIPAPRVHDFSATKNQAKTPYIIMDKVSGQTLGDALFQGMQDAAIRRTLEGLADFRKTLREHPFSQAGSLALGCDLEDDSEDDFYDGSVEFSNQQDDYFVAELITLWAAGLNTHGYRSSCWTSGLEYYFAQHTHSLIAGNMYGSLGDQAEKWMAHHLIASLLPAYVEPTQTFYLAHTDLHTSNIIVDPTDGTQTGIIDWEFANTLPPQAVEHYPTFLTSREKIAKTYHKSFDDIDVEFDMWRAHYAKQFDDVETLNYHERIDTIIQFEYLLHNGNDCSFERISEVVNSLKAANALPSKRLWERSINPTPSINARAHNMPKFHTTATKKVAESASLHSLSEGMFTSIAAVNNNLLSMWSPSSLSVDYDSAISRLLFPSPKHKINGNTGHPPSSPLNSVISSAQSSTLSVKESDKQPNSATQPELSNPPPAIPELEVSAPDNVIVPGPLSLKTAADMGTQTELFKESNKTTELEAIPSDDIKPSQLPPLKSVIDAPVRQTTAKTAVDTTEQTDDSFPPNQSLPQKENLTPHARARKWFNAARIFRRSKRTVLRK
jgi:aminoglycoside phosphotransferase (APT) family kinase protein